MLNYLSFFLRSDNYKGDMFKKEKCYKILESGYIIYTFFSDVLIICALLTCTLNLHFDFRLIVRIGVIGLLTLIKWNVGFI